jgi:hypothetical protein
MASRSIRKVLGEALLLASKSTQSITGKSINALPEYFLSVKSAEHLHRHFKTITFSMEDSMSVVADDLNIRLPRSDTQIAKKFRLYGKTDLVLRSQRSKKLKHIVEFKRSLSPIGIKNDALRLAWICDRSPDGHKAEQNFLVAVTHKSADLFETRSHEIKNLIMDEFDDRIKVTYEPIDLSSLKSTHKNGLDKDLFGGVWEFSYQG